MYIPDWLVSSALTTAALAVVGWFSRKWLSEWIGASVRHDFDARLEGIRSELRAKETQIAALRDGALTNMAALQNATAQRQLRAADDLWRAVTEWSALSGVVAQMGVINFDVASERVENEPKLRQIFEMTSNSVPDMAKLGEGADSARPYLSDITWALFTAYRMVFQVAYMKLTALKHGLDGRKFMDADSINDLMIKAMPDYKDYITQWGHKAHHQLVDVLRDRILAEVRKTIEGKQQDGESVQRAADIVKLADTVQREIDEREAKKEGVPT